MSIQLQMEQRSGYLAARFAGVAVPGEVLQKIELIAEQCKRTNNDKLLIDFTAIRTQFSIMDKYNFGEKSRNFARHNIKVAAIVTREQSDPQKFGELVALNRGANLRGFTGVQAAEEWLLT